MNGGVPYALSADGAYLFPAVFARQSLYAVAIAVQPAGQTCMLVNASGTLTAAVSNVAVTCATNPPPPPGPVRSIAGSIAGLPGGAQLGLVNLGAGLTAAANGGFTFSVADGAPYAISVASAPEGMFCAVDNAGGVATANVATVAVTCRPAQLSILTGSGGGIGRSDGVGTNSRFNRPNGNALDSAGNLYVADRDNGLIR